MRPFVSTTKFQKSINKELTVLKDRVRNLIGDANWAEEGRYKEAVLRNVISRFLPKNISVGTGFILKPESDRRDSEIDRSKQVDIIAYNNACPLLFSEGDFIITTPRNVKGIIEVKTSINKSEIGDIIEKAAFNGKLIDSSDVFNGVFSFDEGDPLGWQGSIGIDALERALRNSRGLVNHICFGPSLFVKFWALPYHEPRARESERYYSMYDLRDLSFAYFISNFIEYVSGTDISDRRGFMYPEDKELHKVHDIFL